MKFISSLFLLSLSLFASPLQEAINNAQNGDIIELGSGVYEGDIVINKPLTIDGKDKRAIIKGSGNSNVITIKSPNVKLLNLTIENSGNSHTTVDSAILCDSSNNVEIRNNDIKNSLFGINFKQCNLSKIVDNNITSKDVDLGLRGDAIRLWYSHENLIENNHIYKSRDMVIWYSSNNQIRKNYGEYGRYSLHFMYAGKNLVENNIFRYNSVGIFFMFSSGSLVKNNLVANSTGAFGVGIGMKDTSDFTVTDNTLIGNARGLYLDQSPFQPNTINKFIKNKIIYNTVGVQFHATMHKSLFLQNDFFGNIDVAINDTPGSKISKNEWEGNYFDDYEGFDKNKDKIGDIEYKNFTYIDSLWQYYPSLRFFYASPVILAINFIAKLAPFSQPALLITDKKPKMEPNNE